jgi:formylglycine-generating enzyme required for sulfatase activity
MESMIEWCTVSSGEVDVFGRREKVASFVIGRYPITVAQFESFVAARGYQEPGFWTEIGWEWRVQHEVVGPGFWNQEVWQNPNHPVVGILWHEADAFCAWVSEREGREISLPSERQRERAARGDRNAPYPWGEHFDERLCNCAESGIGRTTPVDRYPDGQSEFGVFDLSGNVWEWCRDAWKVGAPGDAPCESAAPRVLRGGSFADTSLSMLCEIRARYRSSVRLPNVGFRVVATG